MKKGARRGKGIKQGEKEREKAEGGTKIESEEWGVVWTLEVQRGARLHCEDTVSLIMASQSRPPLTGSLRKAHLP